MKMIALLLVSGLSLLISSASGTSSDRYESSDLKPFDVVLSDWIVMHNLGSEKSIADFINKHYATTLLEEIKMSDHINFYKTIIKEFGAIDPEPLKIISQSSHKMIVHMIKRGIPRGLQDIPPEHILEVEIDLDKDLTHLSRGLGLGALVCKLKK